MRLCLFYCHSTLQNFINKDHVNEVQTNGTYKDCVGKMYIVGWRKSEFERILYFSKYILSTWLQNKKIVSQFE